MAYSENHISFFPNFSDHKSVHIFQILTDIFLSVRLVNRAGKPTEAPNLPHCTPGRCSQCSQCSCGLFIGFAFRFTAYWTLSNWKAHTCFLCEPFILANATWSILASSAWKSLWLKRRSYRISNIAFSFYWLVSITSQAEQFAMVVSRYLPWCGFSDIGGQGRLAFMLWVLLRIQDLQVSGIDPHIGRYYCQYKTLRY